VFHFNLLIFFLFFCLWLIRPPIYLNSVLAWSADFRFLLFDNRKLYLLSNEHLDANWLGYKRFQKRLCYQLIPVFCFRQIRSTTLLLDVILLWFVLSALLWLHNADRLQQKSFLLCVRCARELFSSAHILYF